MFEGNKAGRFVSEGALARLASQLYVQLIRLSEEGLQLDSLSREKIKEVLRQVVL